MKLIYFAAMCAVATFFTISSGTVLGGTLLKRGAYLVNGGAGCGNCHTPRFGPKKGVELAGGFPFGRPKAPFKSYASNITPDMETGIGSWTDAQIKQAITKGFRHDGAKLRPPMCYGCYDNMTDADVDSIINYLRTIRPIRNTVR